MREVMAAISEKGFGSELFRISQDGSLPKTVSYAQGLAKSLPEGLGISEEYARYASDCIVFALGLAVTVKEPSLRRADSPKSSSRWQKSTEDLGPASSSGGAGAGGGGRKDERPDASAGKAVSPGDTLREGTGSGSARSGKETSGASPGAEGSSGDKANLFIWACYVLGLLCGYLSPKGRMALREWWIRWILLIILFSAYAWLYNTQADDSEPVDPWTLRFAVLFSVVSLTGLSAFFLSVRRLHDLNLPGWLAFLLAVLYFFTGQDAIPALFLIWLSFASGTKGPNSYGPDPLA